MISSYSKHMPRGQWSHLIFYVNSVVILAFFLLYKSERKSLDKPNLLPPITDHLDRVLLRVRDVENWRVLGSVQDVGEYLYRGIDGGSARTEANIAFFIQVSSSNILLAPRLLSRIWHPHNFYCLHFDSKISKSAVQRFKNAIKSNYKLSNVFYLQSTSVTYTGITTLLNTLDSIHNLLLHSTKWDYYINLSGSDYPLVSSTTLRRLLGHPSVKGRETSFVHFAPRKSSWSYLSKHRLGLLHFDHALGFNSNVSRPIHQTRQVNPISKSGNIKIVIGKGESWVIAHRSFCEHAAHGNVGRHILALFANMQSSSEHFFQTLSWNHATLNKTVTRHSLREVIWQSNGVRSGQHPLNLDSVDKDGQFHLWNRLSQSPNFFARKFMIPDSPLMDHIDFTKSGATEQTINYTSVSQSLSLVVDRFNCVSDMTKRYYEESIMSCFQGNWIKNQCNRGNSRVCVGEFPPSPTLQSRNARLRM